MRKAYSIGMIDTHELDDSVATIQYILLYNEMSVRMNSSPEGKFVASPADSWQS